MGLLNMKKIIVTAVIQITFSSVSFAQQDTRMVGQYCRLISFNGMFSNTVNIDVDFGDESKFFSDNRMRDEESGKLKKFNTVTDALNYMGSQGWRLVNAFPVAEGNSFAYHYYFKKLFPKAQVR